MDIVIGIDIGGTLVRVGAVDTQGKLLALRESPIEARRGPQAGLERIAALIEELLHEEAVAGAAGTTKLLGIGIGCTGPVDPVKGIVNNPYTLPTWENVPLSPWLERRFSVPVRLENDADAAALGEYWQGAGIGVNRLYAITLGTGIGTALITDGKIYRGVDGCHPEGGHHVIDPSGPSCYCGAHGCWESLASGSAIARLARQAVESTLDLDGDYTDGYSPGPAGAMPDTSISNTEPELINAHLVAEMALKGDPLAMEVMEKAAYHFSLGVVNIVMLFSPEMIVLSGGVMKSAELFLPALREAMQRHSVVVPADKVHIRQAQLGSYAGVYGGAYTILQRLKL
jgi:glucokinase